MVRHRNVLSTPVSTAASEKSNAVLKRRLNRGPVLGGLATTGLLMAAIAPSATQAATLYWDGGSADILTNGNGVSGGGAGTWDTTLLNWDQGIGAHVAWNNSNFDTAVLGGATTPAAISLGADITVGGLRFDTTAYQFITGANTLNFGAANNTVTFNNVAIANFTGSFGGTGNVSFVAANPATAGEARFNGNSATHGWSGTTTINAGMTVGVLSSNRALSNTTGITLNGGNITLTNTDATQGALDRVSNSAAITSNGGTITYTNTSGSTYAESIGSIALTSGQLNIVQTNNMATGSQTLTLGGLTRTGANNTSAINFSLSSTNAANNLVVVTGAGGAMPSGTIIGPWATITTSTSSSDYAAYNASNQIVSGNSTGVAAAGLATGSNPLNSSTTAFSVNDGSARTFGSNGTALGVRIIGSAATWDFANFTLSTNGVLFGGNGNKVLSSTGTGYLTTPGAAGGSLYLTTAIAANSHTVSAPINDNGGAVTLVKSGPGTLTLSSTASNYSGGTVLNAGTLATTADTNLGTGGGVTFNGNAIWNLGGGSLVTYNRTLTINDGAIASFASGFAAKTITGVVSGNGALIWNVATDLLLSNTGNTFNGPITVTTGGTNPYGFSPSSLGDAPGAGMINLGGAATTGYMWWYGGAKTFDDRQFALSGTTGGGSIGNNGSGALNITKDLMINGIGNKTLTLTGSHTATANTFAGNIADGAGSAISLVKDGAGAWKVTGNLSHTGAILLGGGGTTTTGGVVINQGDLYLSGTNTYSGNTGGPRNSNVRTVYFQGIQALSANTTIAYDNVGGVGISATYRILDDGVGTISKAAGLLLKSSDAQSNMTLFVGNNGAANGGNGAGGTTGSTIALGNLNVTENGTGKTSQTLSITGANGYRLQINNVTTNLAALHSGAYTAIFNPTTAPLTIAGNVQQSAGSTGTTTLNLDGTATGNLISGNILNSADVSPKALSVTKSNTVANWTLSGANAYSGTTLISGGTLIGIGANAFGSTSVINMTGSNSPVLSLRGDSSTSFVKASDATPYTVTPTSSGATINVDQATIAGTSAKTMSIGALNTTSTSATYQVNFTGANNTSLSVGAVTGPASVASGSVTLSNGITGGGNFTLASYTSANTTAGETVTFSGNGNTVVSGAITPSATVLSLTKSGGGTLTLSGNSSYTGPTAVNAGKLLVDGNNSLATGTVTVANTATLGGSGTIGGAVTINSGGTISPGNSPGTLTTGAETWNSGGTYVWEINNATGTKGVDPGWDWLSSSGAITIASTSGSPFNINITGLNTSNVSGTVSNFSKTTSYDWIIASGTSVSGFAANKFNLMTSNFTNNNSITGTISNGSFSIVQNSNDIVLHYTAAVDSLSTPASLSLTQSGTAGAGFVNQADNTNPFGAVGAVVDITGSGTNYVSEVDDLQGTSVSKGAATVGGSSITQSPTVVMLWLTAGDATNYQALSDALDPASGYDIAYVADGVNGPGVSDPLYATWNQLKDHYGSFNMLVSFSSGLASGGAFNWDFGTGNSYSSVTVDKIAVVPEPATFGLVTAGLMGLMSTRRRRTR